MTMFIGIATIVVDRQNLFKKELISKHLQRYLRQLFPIILPMDGTFMVGYIMIKMEQAELLLQVQVFHLQPI